MTQSSTVPDALQPKQCYTFFASNTGRLGVSSSWNTQPVSPAFLQLMTLRLDQPHQRHVALQSFQLGFGDTRHESSFWLKPVNTPLRFYFNTL
jgi:hypothetical protein